MIVLGIESSCDETAAAILECRRGRFSLHSNIVASQISIHAKYGGVIPEVAARNHVTTVLPTIRAAVGDCTPDCVAVTVGPGLVTSLLVGVETARTLAYLWKKPLVAVNHIEGHVYANWLEYQDGEDADFQQQNIAFPAVVLIVSGGHTELVLMKGHGKYMLLGATRDDAAGEAFDKVAKILGLGYPGGPEISKYACKGNATKFSLPKPMIGTNDFQFSFSGLKTAVLYLVERLKKENRYSISSKRDIAAAFEASVVEVLVTKTIRAAQKYRAKSILLGGGVVANHALREQMAERCAAAMPHVSLHIPSSKFCTDNAAMIAMAGYFHAMKKDFTAWEKLAVNPNKELAGRKRTYRS